jgi:hypothetical protein
MDSRESNLRRSCLWDDKKITHKDHGWVRDDQRASRSGSRGSAGLDIQCTALDLGKR